MVFMWFGPSHLCTDYTFDIWMALSLLSATTQTFGTLNYSCIFIITWYAHLYDSRRCGCIFRFSIDFSILLFVVLESSSLNPSINTWFAAGLADLKLKLSEGAMLGTWNIKVKVGGRTTSTSFDVDEYVLPKFEVKIKPPTFLTLNITSIPVGICAKWVKRK